MSQGNDSDGISRRRILAGTGAAAGAAAVGGVALSGSAAAASSNFNANEASVSSPDGSVEEVTITPSGGVEWENFDTAVQEINIRIESRILKDDKGGGSTAWKEVVNTSPSIGGHSGLSGSIDNYTLDTTTIYSDTDRFEANEDGSTKSTRIELRLTVELLDSSGDRADPADEAKMVDTTQFWAKSTNQPADADFDAEAGTGMS